MMTWRGVHDRLLRRDDGQLPASPRTADLRHLAGVLVGAYYLGHVVVGFVAWHSDAGMPAGHWIGDDWSRAIFGGLYGLLGLVAFACRVWGWRRGEATLLAFLGLYAALHALMLIAGGSIVSGSRLGIGPLLMWAYAWQLWQSVSQGDVRRGRGEPWRSSG